MIIGTIGYGNVYPVYAPGKAVTSVIIFFSSLLMAVPMTIIIKRFSEAYEQRAQEMRIKKVFGGQFDGAGGHVVTLEDRRVSSKKKKIAGCLTEFRSGRTTWNTFRDRVLGTGKC